MVFHVTPDRRIFLDGNEVNRCTGFKIIANAGRDPEVEFRVSVDEIIVEGYTNHIRQTE